jgi:Protein of unknown function (DUF2516)
VRPERDIDPAAPDSVDDVFTGSAMTPLNIFFFVISIAAFVFEVFAFIDAVRRPAPAFVAAGKQTKPIWLIILGVAFVLGLYAAAYGGATGFLSVAAFVAAAVYLADVRPKVREIRSGSSNNGPYGPW